MKRVITYGTFDLLHYGHINLLKTCESFRWLFNCCCFNWWIYTFEKKIKNVISLMNKEKGLLESVRFVDLVIPEENWDQKIKDIKEYHIDTFVIGDDWKGKIWLSKRWGCRSYFIYQELLKISTTQIKEDLHHTEEKIKAIAIAIASFFIKDCYEKIITILFDLNSFLKIQRIFPFVDQFQS